ncbi:MAG: radical SAM protein [Candidatus ainarchaeum sp.]|nr:radical SAM protein [Candidatus ainarchaeum sp.]
MKLSKQPYFGLGKVPIGIGAVIKGWNIPEQDYHDPEKLPVVDLRVMTSACPRDCFHCFTDKQKKDLTLEEIKSIIDQLAELHTRAIDFLGEGEPTLDEDFFEIIGYTAKKGIQPIVFTEAATKMRDIDFVRKIKKTGASICPKCDSLFNPEYQNWVVRDKTGKYFEQRNEAINLLIKEGFNKVEKDGTTRLGFVMVISRKNMHEVEKTLRYCRENNLWVVFNDFLPAGRSGKDSFDRAIMLNEEEKKVLRKTVERVDKEYGFEHPIYNNFATMPCVEFIEIWGNGNVSPCDANETIIGNIRENSIRKLQKKIIEKFPMHDRKTCNGTCPYRPKIPNQNK